VVIFFCSTKITKRWRKHTRACEIEMHKMAEKRKRKETVTSYGHDEEGNGENGIKEEGIEQPLKKQKSALNEHQEQVSICLMLFINILTRNFRIFTCP
jgi:hypothetical protein